MQMYGTDLIGFKNFRYLLNVLASCYVQGKIQSTKIALQRTIA